jgi:hypothetical protein
VLSRFARVWAAALLGAALAAAPAAAQNAPPDLRGSDDAVAPPADASDEAAPDADAVPRKPKPKSDLLPKLTPYPGAQRIGLKGGPDPVADPPGPTVAAPSAAPRHSPRREDDPFAPVGFYAGNLRLTPYVEQDVGYATNPLGVVGAARGSGFSETEVGVAMKSNWSRNELTGSAKLGYYDYFTAPGASAPYGSGLVDYRLDASRDLSFDTEGRYSLGTETNAQLGLGGTTSQQLTLVSAYGATAGAVQKFGDLSIGLHGSVDRTQYQGGDLDTDDSNDYGLKLRASYRLSEAVSPFAEVDGDDRVYDDKVDASGYARASNGVSGKAGLRISFSEMLTGEGSVGYGVRDYTDPRLPNVGAPLIDGSLIWSPTPLTTVTLKTATTLQDAVVGGASADIDHSYTINLDHAFTERIKLGLSAGLATDRYIGIDEHDHTYSLGLTGEYHLSRDVVLKASVAHQQFLSNLPGSSYKSDTAMIGVRLQR